MRKSNNPVTSNSSKLLTVSGIGESHRHYARRKLDKARTRLFSNHNQQGKLSSGFTCWNSSALLGLEEKKRAHANITKRDTLRPQKHIQPNLHKNSSNMLVMQSHSRGHQKATQKTPNQSIHLLAVKNSSTVGVVKTCKLHATSPVPLRDQNQSSVAAHIHIWNFTARYIALSFSASLLGTCLLFLAGCCTLLSGRSPFCQLQKNGACRCNQQKATAKKFKKPPTKPRCSLPQSAKRLSKGDKMKLTRKLQNFMRSWQSGMRLLSLAGPAKTMSLVKRIQKFYLRQVSQCRATLLPSSSPHGNSMSKRLTEAAWTLQVNLKR